MRKAVTICKKLDELQRESDKHRLPPEDFLSEEQDVRGLPMSWCEWEAQCFKRHKTSCTAIYDYDSVPDVVVTNGEDDWPIRYRKVLQA